MNKRILLILITLLSLTIPNFAYTEQFRSVGTTDIYFSPNGGCTAAIVREINNARKSIFIQAYSFTSVLTAKALLYANKRGVKIEAVLDKSQRTERYTSATFLRNAGISVYIDDKHAIAHNKIMIIDGYTLITGSFNFTKSAEERNAENLLIIKGNVPLINYYWQNYLEHRGHSERY
jgi:phosphatidylserine/phosphatidylglycerophosphate/cardiolipin synthase-like enzyme